GAGGHVLAELGGGGGADPGDLAARLEDEDGVLAQALELLGGAPVGADAEDALLPELEVVGHLLEEGGELGVPHSPMIGPATRLARGARPGRVPASVEGRPPRHAAYNVERGRLPSRVGVGPARRLRRAAPRAGRQS